MLNVIVKVTKIAVGVAVGLVADKVLDNYVIDPIQKKINSKKVES